MPTKTPAVDLLFEIVSEEIASAVAECYDLVQDIAFPEPDITLPLNALADKLASFDRDRCAAQLHKQMTERWRRALDERFNLRAADVVVTTHHPRARGLG